jgi:hypothetical protein
MSTHSDRRNVPINVALHPRVYAAIVGLVLWLVASMWFFFGDGAHVGLILAMITVFFTIVTGIQTLIWLSWRHNAPAAAESRTESYHDWAMHPFSTWTEKLSGSAAVAQLMVPLAAVSFGMTAISLVYYFVSP